MLPTCRRHVVTAQDFAPILARWVGVADTKLKMSGPFVSAWADILISRQKPDQPKCVCRNILWYGSYICTDTHPHALNALFWCLVSWLSCLQHDQALDLSSELLGRGNLPGPSIVRWSKKDNILMTKGEGIGSQTRVWYDGSCGIGGKEGRSRYVYGTK